MFLQSHCEWYPYAESTAATPNRQRVEDATETADFRARHERGCSAYRTVPFPSVPIPSPHIPPHCIGAYRPTCLKTNIRPRSKILGNIMQTMNEVLVLEFYVNSS